MLHRHTIFCRCSTWGMPLLVTFLLGFSAAGFAQNAPVPVYSESFTQPASTPIIRVNAYTPANGVTFTADAPWLINCNGWIAQWAQPATYGAPPPNADAQILECGGSTSTAAWNSVQLMAQALGIAAGQTQTAAQQNFAVSANTSGFPGVDPTNPSGWIEFQTSQISLAGIPGGGTGRFLTFTVNVAARNCNFAHPLFNFYLVNQANVETRLGTQRVDVCSDAPANSLRSVNGRGVQTAQDVLAWTVRAPGALLYMGGSTVGLRFRNEQPSGAGNDHAFDDIQLLDVTPSMTKTFASPVRMGVPTTLTFTITNTTELFQKQGWSFTDTLPAGLEVASPSNLVTTCGPGTTLASTTNSITVSNGDLPAGAISCTITASVVASTPGTYTNGPSNIVPSVGVNAPSNSTLVVQGQVQITKISNRATGTFDFTATNTTPGSASITTTAAGGAGTSLTTPLNINGNGNPIVITEAAVAGWRLDSISCTKPTGGGNFTPTYDIPNRRVTIPVSNVNEAASFACTFTNTQVQADLVITKTNTPGLNNGLDQANDTVTSGASTSYDITVSNLGPDAANGAIFSDSASSRTGITCSTVTCTVPTGSTATCPAPASLTVAALDTGIAIPTLPANSNLRFTLGCTIN